MKINRGKKEPVAKSVSNLVVPPDQVDKLELAEPSYKAEHDKERVLKEIAGEINDDPLADLPRPKHMEKVPLPLIEEIPKKPAQEPVPSLKPDHESISAYRASKGLFVSKFSPDKWRIFCQHYAETGRQVESAKMAGVNSSTVFAYRKNNPDFAEMFAEAADEYKERIHREVYRRGVEGVEEEIYGKEGLLGTKRVYSDRLLELEAKRVDPSYRDKGNQIDLAMTGGVLVVRDRGEVKQSDWENEYNGAAVVDVESTEVKES